MVFSCSWARKEPVSDAARDEDVILRAITLLSENRFNCTAAFEDKDDLVGAAVLIILELAVRFFRARAPCGHVLIEKNWNAPAVEIALSRNVRRAQMMMAQRAVGRFLQFLALQQLDAAHARGRTQMIHD